MSDKGPFIVSPDWLEERLGKPGLSIVDASWYLPAANRNGREEYNKAHIPGAVFFDHDKICNPTSHLPHTIPSQQDFGRHVSAMGLTNNDIIVVYDGPGFFSAPRAWWLFRIMGAKAVYVLDGGLDQWVAQQRPVTDEPSRIAPSAFYAHKQRDRIVTLDEMRERVDQQDSQIADARGEKRFSGQESEPRANMRSGHMPGANNVPATLLSKQGQFLPLEDIEKIFREQGIDPQQPTITTCGSGITAAVLALGLESLGNSDVRLYDGSWSEWGGLADTPVVTGRD